MQSTTEGAHAYTRKFYHAHGWDQLRRILKKGQTVPHRDQRWIFGEANEAHSPLTVLIIERTEEERIVGAVEAREESPYERRGVLVIGAPSWRPSDEDKRPFYVELTLDDTGQKSSVARSAWEWLIQKMAAATETTEPSEDDTPTVDQVTTPDSEVMIGPDSGAIGQAFTFAGTVDELLEVVREWRAWLPGKPVDATAGLSSSYVIHEPGWQMNKGTNPDIYTTKRLSEHERVNLGAVAPHEDGGAVRQITVKVSLLKYGISLTNPIRYSLGEEPNLENFWFYLAEHYGNLTVYFRRQAGGLVGRLEFPEAVQGECAILLDRLSAWDRSKPRKIPVRVVISSLDQIPVFPVITLNDFWLKRYADESRLWADSIVNLMAPIEEMQKSIQAAMAPAVAMMDVLSKSVQPFVLEIEEASRVLQGMSFLRTDPMFQSFGHLENFQIAANLSVDIATTTRSDEIVISRPVDHEGIRAAVREELQTWGGQYENRLVMRVAAEIGIQKRAGEIARADEATMQPPSPDVKGWDAVFNWFYRAPRYYCLTLKTLAKMVSCSESHLLREHAKYKAEYGERPMH